MRAVPVKLSAWGGLPADVQQLLFALESPDFIIDFAATEGSDASIVHADHLDVAALPNADLIVFADAADLARFEAMPQVVAALEWPSSPEAVRRSLSMAARWVRREWQLRALASTDPLTGLLNRRGFEERAKRHIERCRCEGEGAAVLLVDLDHFKRVNDVYGHAAGDAVLRSVGDLLPGLTRANDVVGRVGGEELAIVLPCVTPGMARETAERLRAAIAELVVVCGSDRLRVTASIGFCLTDAGTDYEAALREADDALYEAKARGRNCVVGSREAPGVRPVPPVVAPVAVDHDVPAGTPSAAAA